jgi:Tfp pilus assembly protein PilF
MTNSNRLEQLLKFYKEDPNDAFTIYAIATEYLKSDTSLARQYFEILLSKHPEYLPTYYHVAHLYEELNKINLAENAYLKGIALAEKQGNTTTLRELKNALDELMF